MDLHGMVAVRCCWKGCPWCVAIGPPASKHDELMRQSDWSASTWLNHWKLRCCTEPFDETMDFAPLLRCANSSCTTCEKWQRDIRWQHVWGQSGSLLELRKLLKSPACNVWMRLEACQKSFLQRLKWLSKHLKSKNDFEESEGPKSEIDRNAEICLTTLHSRQAPVQLGPRATSLPSTRQHWHPTSNSRKSPKPGPLWPLHKFVWQKKHSQIENSSIFEKKIN